MFSFLGLSVLVFAVVFAFPSLGKVLANEVVPEEFEGVEEDYNLEEVEFVNAEDLDGALNFDTIEEFEAFLKNEKMNEMNDNTLQVPTSPDLGFVTFAAAPKTYTYKEYTGVSTITSYVKVTRNTKGIVTKVVVWSSQTGVAFPISYLQNATDYTLNSTEKGGKAYIYGSKSYGVTVGGQGITYKKDVTYTVSF